MEFSDLLPLADSEMPAPGNFFPWPLAFATRIRFLHTTQSALDYSPAATWHAAAILGRKAKHRLPLFDEGRPFLSDWFAVDSFGQGFPRTRQ